MAYQRSTGTGPNLRGTGPSSFYAQQNEQLEDSLANKVQALKNISINIGTEVQNQNKLLNSMNDDSDILTSMLSGSMSRLKKLAKGGYCKTWVQIGIFVFCVFVVMYFILRLRWFVFSFCFILDEVLTNFLRFDRFTKCPQVEF